MLKRQALLKDKRGDNLYFSNGKQIPRKKEKTNPPMSWLCGRCCFYSHSLIWIINLPLLCKTSMSHRHTGWQILSLQWSTKSLILKFCSPPESPEHQTYRSSAEMGSIEISFNPVGLCFAWKVQWPAVKETIHPLRKNQSGALGHTRTIWRSQTGLRDVPFNFLMGFVVDYKNTVKFTFQT